MAIQEDFDLVYRDAAEVYYRMEEFKKSISMFETAEEKSGGFEDYSFRIGLCYERTDDLKAARYHYRKATRQDPYLHEAFFRIGETYRMEDRLEAALVNYKKALKYDESNEDYICTIVSIYKMLDRDNEVINYLNWLVNVRPDITTYWLDLIIYLLDIDRYEEALETTAEAIQRSGQYAEFYYLQSAALYYCGKEKESHSVLEHALSLDYARHLIMYEVCKDFANNPRIQDLINLYKKN
jgi:tetratricopeptide (TPR) repeat protein